MVKQIDIRDELSQNFIDFSYEANSARAFADARDGLKPGQRACLWEMYHKGYLSNKPHVKSAKIAGAVTGNWWPHGDVAIYDTFARMSQPWINNIPEVDWHGNNGSQYTGPDCAAPRYTEARLSKAAEIGLFSGIKKHNVEMILNYSEDDEWPEVLPAVLPRLMINGCQGIGSTIANVWLPHTLADVADVILNYMDTAKLDYSNLYPSFPTGGTIINKNDIHTIYETGKGKVVLRGKAETKENKILITELPYQVYVQPYVEKIKDMAIKDELTGIEAIYNKSGKDTLLIEIDCEDNAEKVLKQLYLKTDLQKNYNANQWALIGKTPKLLTLKDYCDVYINHNLNCIVKEACFDKDKALARQHIVSGLLKALEDIDNIVALIKSSQSATVAKDRLIEKYAFTEIQAKAIIDMKLGKLAGLEKVELEQENTDLIKTIEECTALIDNINIQKAELKTRLSALVKKYGDARRTELVQIEVPKEEKENAEVIPEDVVVILTQTGDIKRIPRQSFRTQKRGGKGVKNADEAILNTISTNTIDNFMLFTSKGKMYRLLVDNVPAGTAASRGINVSSLVNMEPDEKVIAMTSLYHQTNAKYAVFITKQGLIKKTFLDEYFKVKRSTGIAAINIKDGDSLANVTFLDEEDVIIITKKGMAIHFATNEINPIGRVTAGVRSIKLIDGDEVLIGLPIHKETDMVAIITTKGYGKKCKIDEFPWQLRGGKGVCVYKVSGSTGDIAGAAMVDDNDSLLLVGKPNSICIPTTELPSLSRISMGNIMIKNNVTSVVKL